jgi:hypothetical protein
VFGINCLNQINQYGFTRLEMVDPLGNSVSIDENILLYRKLAFKKSVDFGKEECRCQ